MSQDTLRIVDDSDSLVFDFNDHAGAVNADGLKSRVRFFDIGVSDPEREWFEGSPSRLIFEEDQRTEAKIGVRFEAADYEALRGSVGRLARLLRNPAHRILWKRDGAPDSAKQYLHYLTGDVTNPVGGEDRDPIHSYYALREGIGIDLEVTIFREPDLREVEETIGPITVSNNPAATNGRSMSVDIDSSAPTPARVTAKAGTGSSLTSILAASKALLPADAVDYGDTKFAQCESSGGGWTVALTGGTTPQSDGNASGGNAAQTSYGSNPTVMAKRDRITRTTKLNSLRGRWDVYVRPKANNAARHELQLRWSPSLADPATNTEERVVLDTTGLAAFDYVRPLRVGTIEIPEKGTLGGLALELWSRRVSGTGTLNWDYVWLVPADRAALITVPGDAEDFWQGKDIVSPPHKLASDPTWTAGAYGGGILSLRAANEGGGTPPNTGLGIGTGRNRVSFRLTRVNFIGTVKWRVVNVTDGTEVAAGSVSSTNGASVTRTPSLEFDSVAGKLYQFQAVLTAASQGRVDVERIDHSFVPVLGAGEQVHADPEAGRVDRLNAAGAHLNPLQHAGPVPFVLDPDTNILAFGLGDVPLPGYTEDHDVLTRTADVTITYAPRRYV